MNEICCFYQFFCAFVCVCVYCIERCGANVCISTVFKILFRRFNSPESDPPHKIMRYWV